MESGDKRSFTMARLAPLAAYPLRPMAPLVNGWRVRRTWEGVSEEGKNGAEERIFGIGTVVAVEGLVLLSVGIVGWERMLRSKDWD